MSQIALTVVVVILGVGLAVASQVGPHFLEGLLLAAAFACCVVVPAFIWHDEIQAALNLEERGARTQRSQVGRPSRQPPTGPDPASPGTTPLLSRASATGEDRLRSQFDLTQRRALADRIGALDLYALLGPRADSCVDSVIRGGTCKAELAVARAKGLAFELEDLFQVAVNDGQGDEIFGTLVREWVLDQFEDRTKAFLYCADGRREPCAYRAFLRLKRLPRHRQAVFCHRMGTGLGVSTPAMWSLGAVDWFVSACHRAGFDNPDPYKHWR